MERQQGKLHMWGARFYLSLVAVVDFDTFGEYNVMWKSEGRSYLFGLELILDNDRNQIEEGGHLCNMANIITSIRIGCSIALLVFPVFSPVFYALYILAGASDMIDGAVARKTETVSDFGSKLDTGADFVLVVVCLIKLIPIIHVPIWLIIWIIVIAVIKAINLISGYVMRKEIVVLHTATNKITGILLFVLPLTLTFIDLKYSGAVVSTLATFAAIQEGHIIRTESK